MNELTGSYEVPSWDGSKMHSVKRDITEMKKGIRPIRIRAGLPDYDKVKGHETAYDDPNEFRRMLKRERQIEFLLRGIATGIYVVG